MEVIDQQGNPISTVDEWRERAGPASPDQWQDGYSAKELAKAWAPTDGTGAAQEVAAVLRLALNDERFELVRGFPERRTRFDANPRGPRVHDLLIHARGEAGPVVIGVEGKGYESFGLPLGAHLAAATNPNSGTPARVHALVNGFFGRAINEVDGLEQVGYQLLSTLAGTLVEAKESGAELAIVFVHEFTFDHTDAEAQIENQHQLETFIRALDGRVPKDDDETPDHWWITDEVSVPGATELMAATTRVRFAKLITHRSSPQSAPGLGTLEETCADAEGYLKARRENETS